MINEVQSLIATFTNDLTQLVQRQSRERILSALGGTVPARRGPKPGRKPGRPTGKRSYRTAEDSAKIGEGLLAHVSANPGEGASEIAAAVGTDVDSMRAPMKMLIEAGSVRTEGQKRGTTYHPGSGTPKRAGKAKKAKRGGKRKAA